MNDVLSDLDRRRFLEFLGVSTAALGVPWSALAAGNTPPFKALSPSTKDELAVASGFRYEILVKFGDVINAAGDKFGYDNDFTASVGTAEGEALLWVNHEFANSLFLSGVSLTEKRTKAQIDLELDAVGGSILKIKADKAGQWRFVPNDPLNRRITGKTPIDLVCDEPIAGSKTAIGTFMNCSGGKTPWNTFLSGEENYHAGYGELDYAAYQKGERKLAFEGELGWSAHYPLPPEHYGWIVEIEPKNGKAKKLTALGRFAHEGATVVTAKDGRPVAYMGDDANDECIYKFIGDKPGSLERGTLYVADIKGGRWLPLDRKQDKRLEKEFKSQIDVLIWARRAAALVGGTKLDRPEGIAVHPATDAVFISLTNNASKGVLFGSLLKIEEQGGDHTAMTFKASTFLAGGQKTGFACPDNICFDRRGNLWMTTDMSEKVMNKGEFAPFGNNSLFVIPTFGTYAGVPLRVASAPSDAEFTGPSFSPDGRTLFLSVQHPGGGSKSLKALTSHWPDGGDSQPKPAVVALRGDFLDALA